MTPLDLTFNILGHVVVVNPIMLWLVVPIVFVAAVILMAAASLRN